MRARILPCKGFFPLPISFILMVLFLAGCGEDSRILDNGKSRQLEFSVSTHGWNNSTTRATPISGNTFDTSKNFNVIVDVNKGGSWSTEINNETASYSTASKIWQTSKIHYWPGIASTVNFYAYYPTSISSSITHSLGSAPILSYTVHDNTADQIDILAFSKAGVVGNSYNQIPVDFKHIFAAVQFQVGSSGLPSGTISSISIGNIANSGTYIFGSGWSNVTGSKNFTVSPSAAINGTSGESITSGTYTLMMIPQTFADATLTLTYSTGTSYTKAISGSWSAGNSYTYNLSKVPGQYLYSDGTWGNYDSNKMVIGIVFSNTTSSTDKSHGWTHGYAMALQNAGSSSATYQWYTSNSGNPTGSSVTTPDQIMSDKDGYAHSGYLQTSGYAAGIAAHGYTAKNKSGNAVAAPSGTSGWYLPSIGQWYDICDNLGGMVTASGKAYTNSSTYWLRWYSGDIGGDTHNYSGLCASNLNVYLNGLKNNGYSVDLFSNSNEYYWSSSEYESYCAYCVRFYSNDGVYLDCNCAKMNSFRVRAVIAF